MFFLCYIEVLLPLADMPARVSESLILRTYPFREADLVVSFLTRDQGKLRGVARRARRPKSGFGAGLERLSHVQVSYFQRENRELVSLDSCELIRSQFELQSDYAAGVALDYIGGSFRAACWRRGNRMNGFSGSCSPCWITCGRSQGQRPVAGGDLLQPCGQCGCRVSCRPCV